MRQGHAHGVAVTKHINPMQTYSELFSPAPAH